MSSRIRLGLCATLVSLFLLFPVSMLRAQDPPSDLKVRKNVDELFGTEELENYKHAVRKLMARDSDPNSTSSYRHFANLHNVFTNVSGCEHENELFFPWHRSLLHAFEKALQASDPPRTSNVTIPYWNWTVRPGGVRYPLAFEDQTSPLFNRFRRRTAAAPLFNETTINGIILDNSNWNAFAGMPGEAGGGYGALEAPYHNDMHGWIGRPMNFPQTAAEDPIFWSFHAYIDLIWHRWQTKWQSDPTCLDCALRGLPGKTVRDLVNIETQLGYTYATPPAGPGFLLERLNIPLLSIRPEAPLKTARAANQAGPFFSDVRIPNPGFTTAHIYLADVKLPETQQYGGDVYLFPTTIPFRPNNAAFRRRYFVGRFSVWLRHRPADGAVHDAGHDHDTANVFVEATTEFRYLSKTQPGTRWKVGINITPAPALTPEELRNAPAPRVLPLAQEVQFGGVSVVLDHDFRTKPDE